MGVDFGFHPCPKPTKQKREKDTPKLRVKKPKKKKNPYLYRGRVIPSRKERTKITKENYNRMIEEYGAYCQECGYTPIFAHHLVFRSSMGSGNWRNLAPLCQRCHDRAHKDFEFAEYLRVKRAAEHGEHFWKDVYTLFKEGLVNNTTPEAYDRFFKSQSEKSQ
ncbi:HNH endonuclease [Metabacillus sp. Hm71]|uniref:HNH endonuclease n=1 Tax=Metabacillus sp. Hm71 TaxID=3450743 RepID=UPI003F4352DE